MKPSEEYTIHILEDEDFDKLPYGDPRDALGMTNAKTKTAWVRRSHVRELDINTINHEFDELMAKTSEHEIDGIRYKKGKSIFRSIFNIIPGLGNAIFGPPPAPKISIPQAQPIRQFTSAFAPPSASTTPGPLSDADFQEGLSSISSNLQARLGNIRRLPGFLGQSEAQNTALASQIGSARSSSETERQNFIQQQEERKRSAGLVT